MGFSRVEHVERVGKELMDFSRVEHVERVGKELMDFSRVEHVERVGKESMDFSRVEHVERVGKESMGFSRVEHVERVGKELMDFSRVEYVEELKTLASKVGQVAYGVHEYFGVGLLEKVYETALEHRLVKGGFKVERQKSLNVYDEDGFCVGEYFADLLVDEKLIVELKAAKTLSSEHLAQVLNYMKITRQPVALLVNFGSYKFERRTIVNSTLSPTSSLSPDSPPSTWPNLSSHPQPIPSPSQPSTRSTCSTRPNFLPVSQSQPSTCSTRLNFPPVSQPQSSTCSTRLNPNHEV